MYWNIIDVAQKEEMELLIDNIRCIEINALPSYLPTDKLLIDNIRCIEINGDIVKISEAVELIDNIRCIEIYNLIYTMYDQQSWLITLDVLKSF